MPDRVVELRAVTPDDLETFYAHQLDPDATRMAGFASRDREAFMPHWTGILAHVDVTKRSIWVDGELVGNIVCWPQAGERRIGYWLGKAYWGRGLATAALERFLVELTLRPLTARVATHNLGSVRVLEKCGFNVSGKDSFTNQAGERQQELVLTLDS